MCKKHFAKPRFLIKRNPKYDVVKYPLLLRVVQNLMAWALTTDGPIYRTPLVDFETVLLTLRIT